MKKNLKKSKNFSSINNNEILDDTNLSGSALLQAPAKLSSNAPTKFGQYLLLDQSRSLGRVDLPENVDCK